MPTSVVTARDKCLVLQERYYDRQGWVHAYGRYERSVMENLEEGQRVLDVGCGRTFPLANKLATRTELVFGIDPLVEPERVPAVAAVERATGEDMPFAGNSFDMVVCRSVLEHVNRPERFLAEVGRVLKPGGRFVFLTPSKYDYASVAARLIPNRWHPWLVRLTEGREERDTFPVLYRANSKGRVRRLARLTGLQVHRLEYLHHCPTYLMFSPTLYRLGVLYDQVVCGPGGLAFLRGWMLGVLGKRRDNGKR